MSETEVKEFVNSVSGQIVGAAIRLHQKLGPGLLERVYETVLARDLVRIGLKVERQKLCSFDFEGLWFDGACRVDLMVENCVIVEVKSVETMKPLFEKQLLSYLRLTATPVGLLLNFGAPTMKDGIKRLANWPKDT